MCLKRVACVLVCLMVGAGCSFISGTECELTRIVGYEKQEIVKHSDGKLWGIVDEERVVICHVIDMETVEDFEFPFVFARGHIRMLTSSQEAYDRYSKVVRSHQDKAKSFGIKIERLRSFIVGRSKKWSIEISGIKVSRDVVVDLAVLMKQLERELKVQNVQSFIFLEEGVWCIREKTGAKRYYKKNKEGVYVHEIYMHHSLIQRRSPADDIVLARGKHASPER